VFRFFFRLSPGLMEGPQFPPLLGVPPGQGSVVSGAELPRGSSVGCPVSFVVVLAHPRRLCAPSTPCFCRPLSFCDFFFHQRALCRRRSVFRQFSESSCRGLAVFPPACGSFSFRALPCLFFPRGRPFFHPCGLCTRWHRLGARFCFFAFGLQRRLVSFQKVVPHGD